MGNRTRSTSNDIDEQLIDLLCQHTKASGVSRTTRIQRLWDDYGEILRCELNGAAYASVIVKHVRLSEAGARGASSRSRGRNIDRSHQRKVRSYQVESRWYEHWAARCGPHCRVPRCLALATLRGDMVVVLEDLDAAGFPERRRGLRLAEMDVCLRWLAWFHATFLGDKPNGLWRQGTYWHLATRPDELAALCDKPLKDAAAAIDELLRRSPYQTIVHGDAKLENFCFAKRGDDVAAIDFQYVGRGCGMSDVAYFVGSCLEDNACGQYEGQLLDTYFTHLAQAMSAAGRQNEFAAVEQSWRALYPVAWVDFYRFLKGWSPGRYGAYRYSERLAREVIASLATR
jgi:hypothetical protein